MGKSKSQVKFKELPPLVQKLLRDVRKNFLSSKTGKLGGIVFSCSAGEYVFRDVSMMMERGRETIEMLMICDVRDGAELIGMISEGFVLESSQAELKEKLAVSKNRQIHKHPDRKQCVLINAQTKDMNWLCTAQANVTPRVMQPWDIVAMSSADMEEGLKFAGLNEGPMYQNIFKKAAGQWPPKK
jgi:hypothetical protein